MDAVRWLRPPFSSLRRSLICMVFTTAGAIAAEGQSSSGVVQDTVKPNDCKGNFLERSICKGASKLTQAAIGGGLVAPPKLGGVAPPDLPLFGTYRVWLVQQGGDSLSFAVRTISPLDSRAEHGEWTAYSGRFVSAMAEADLPTSLEAPDARSQTKVSGGPWMLLTSSKDSARFAIQLPTMLPLMHPSVMKAKGTWIEDAIESAPPLRGWSRREYVSAANGNSAASERATTFEISWKSKKHQYALKGTRLTGTVLVLGGKTP